MLLGRGRKAFAHLINGEVTFTREQDGPARSSKAVDLAVTGVSTDALGVTKGKVRAPRGGVRAICRKPNFFIPIARPGRITTPDNRTTINFRTQSQSRTARHRLKSSKFSPAQHGSYLERPEALPLVNASSERAGSPFAPSTGYIERFQALTHLEKGSTFVPLSNIGDTAEKRRRFWEAVDRFEPVGNPDRFSADLTNPSGIIHRIALDPECPAALRAVIANANGAPAVSISDLDNELIRQLAQRHGCRAPLDTKERKAKQKRTLPNGASDPRPTFEEAGLVFTDGRAGRTQIQGNGELPEELSSAGKQRALERIHRIFDDRGLPIVTVMHAPDHNNVASNWHFHFAAYDRPCAQFENKREWLERPSGHLFDARCRGLANRVIEDKALDAWVGKWDFEVEYSYQKKSRNKVVSRPFRQVKDRLLNKKDFPRWLREQVVNILNDELKAEGHSRRYDARTYSVMGIDKQPDEHLDKEASQLEKCGIPTEKGIANEERQWAATTAQLDRASKQTRGEAWLLHEKVAWLASGVKGADRIVSEAELHAARAIDAERAAAELTLLMERARSRANATKLHCERVLDAIEKGKASKQERADREHFESRHRDAQLHLIALDQYFEQQQADIEDLKAQSREARKKADQLYTAAYDMVVSQRSVTSIEPKVEQTATSVSATPSRAAGSESAAAQQVRAKRVAFEREMLLHIIRVERLDVGRQESKLVVGTHPSLTPRYRQHIDNIAHDVLTVGKAVQDELNAFRRELQKGAAEGPYMRFLMEKRPDIVAELTSSRPSIKQDAAIAAAITQQGLGW